MPRFLLAFALAALAAAPLSAQSTPAGLYRTASGEELRSVIEIAQDGRFRYQLIDGVLEEEASGQWTRTEDGIALTTLPRPRAPEWQITSIGETQDSPLSVRIRVQGGDDLLGIYLRIGFTNGDRQAASTDHDGWAMDAAETRQPAWIEFSEPVHGATSRRFDLPERRGIALDVTLVPNQIGVAAFEETPATTTRDGFTLHWRGRDIAYERVGRSRTGR